MPKELSEPSLPPSSGSRGAVDIHDVHSVKLFPKGDANKGTLAGEDLFVVLLCCCVVVLLLLLCCCVVVWLCGVCVCVLCGCVVVWLCGCWFGDDLMCVYGHYTSAHARAGR